MDPYLESHWLDVHGTLITAARAALNRTLPDDLIARSEERLVIDSTDDIHGLHPDVRVFRPGLSETNEGGIALNAPYKLVVDLEPAIERFIRIVQAKDEQLITVIEFLSPSNKREPGLTEFRAKRAELIDAGAHFVEIDLIRTGNWRGLLRPHLCPSDAVEPYRAVIRLGGRRGGAYLYPLPIEKPLGSIPIPLRPNDPLVELDLQALIAQVYAEGRYARTTEYGQPCEPPLEGRAAAWADEMLQAAGKR